MINRLEKYFFVGLIIVCFLLSLLVGFQLDSHYTKVQKNNAKALLTSYCELIEDKLKSVYNYTDQFSGYIQSNPQADIKSTPIYKEIMAKEEVMDIIIKTKEQVKLSGSSAKAGNLDKDYPYRLAVLRKELITYGPIKHDSYDKDILISILPIYHNNELICCVAIILDAQQIIDQLDIDILSQNLDYDYQLWTVSAETGHKLVLATSNEKADYLNVVEESFEMPAKWSLLVKPKTNWGISIWPIVFVGTLMGIFIARLLYLHLISKKEKEELAYFERIDRETQFLNLYGLLEHLQKNLSQNTEMTIFIVETIHAHKIYNMLDVNLRDEWTNNFILTLKKYAKNKTVVARIQESMFAIVYEEYFDEKQILDIQRELEIDIIQSVIIDDTRMTLQPVIRYFHCTQVTNIEKKIAEIQKEIWQQL